MLMSIVWGGGGEGPGGDEGTKGEGERKESEGRERGGGGLPGIERTKAREGRLNNILIRTLAREQWVWGGAEGGLGGGEMLCVRMRVHAYVYMCVCVRVRARACVCVCVCAVRRWVSASD